MADPVVELPKRRILVAASLLAAAIFVSIPVWTVRAVLTSDSLPVGQLVIGGVATLLLVVVPLWGALQFHRQHVYVGPDRVQLRFGARVVRDLAYADLTEVDLTLDGPNQAAVLVGVGTDGQPTGFKVTSNQVQTLDPLVEALRAARPELLRRRWS